MNQLMEISNPEYYIFQIEKQSQVKYKNSQIWKLNLKRPKLMKLNLEIERMKLSPRIALNLTLLLLLSAISVPLKLGLHCSNKSFD